MKIDICTQFFVWGGSGRVAEAKLLNLANDDDEENDDEGNGNSNGDDNQM